VSGLCYGVLCLLVAGLPIGMELLGGMYFLEHVAGRRVHRLHVTWCLCLCFSSSFKSQDRSWSWDLHISKVVRLKWSDGKGGLPGPRASRSSWPFQPLRTKLTAKPPSPPTTISPAARPDYVSL
jgi:hypothetical protein